MQQCVHGTFEGGCHYLQGFPGGSKVKVSASNAGDPDSILGFDPWVQSLGWEDPLEKKMATHSSILACRMPWLEEPGRLQSTGSQLPPPQFGLRSNDR